VSEEYTWEDEDISVDDSDLVKDSSDGDERITSALALSKDSYTLSPAVIAISEILVPRPVKDSRRETYKGISRSIEELGVLNPVHVMVTESYAEHLDEGKKPEDFEGYKYVLIDGLRRLFSATKGGLKKVNAMVWNFKDKEKGSEALLLISLVLNKHQRKSWSEIWYLYQILEETSALTPGEIEYLLGLETGDASKLKEIMTRADDFPEPKDDLLAKKKNLQQSFNALNKAMKEQDALSKEDISGVSGMQQVDGIVEAGGSDNKLSDSQVKEILDMDDGDLELQEDDFDAMLNPGPEVQKVGDRHPLDPALKAESLMHDGYKCTCCGLGEFLPMRYKLAILQSHHKISVANGGPDSVENLATLCQSCHTLVHTLLWCGLKFGMSKEDFDALPTDEREKLKNILRLAKIDYEAARRLGKNMDRVKEDNRNPSQFKMPMTDMRQNAEAIREYNSRNTQ
jgi:5-methylcytosine-specific restriction protein A